MSHPAATLPSFGDLHDEQIVALLRSGAHAALLSAYFGDVEYRELCQLAKLAAIRRNERGPLVFVLPGIMGSKLGLLRGKAVELLWLHPHAIAAGHLTQLALPGTRRLKALGVMLPGYLKLKLSLEIAGFRAVFHPFDWRQDVDRLGRMLVQDIERATTQRISIVAHSMGGLVARAALRYDTQRRIGRLVQLGTPNLGSFAPVQALRAVYPTVRKIAALDPQHTAEELARAVFHSLPGLYHLLPSRQSDRDADLFDVAAWPADAFAPDAALLSHARQTRANLPQADERCLHIAGMNQETITAIAPDAGGLAYRITRNGDGTVPVALAQWPGVRTWYADESHGGLTGNSRVISAIVDLLHDNDTQRLADQRPAHDPHTVRSVTDGELRTQATMKVSWESLSPESRRQILEPKLSPEFLDTAT